MFTLRCIADLIKKLELCLMVVSALNLGTPKLVCAKLVYQCQKQLVSTPDGGAHGKLSSASPGSYYHRLFLNAYLKWLL